MCLSFIVDLVNDLKASEHPTLFLLKIKLIIIWEWQKQKKQEIV